MNRFELEVNQNNIGNAINGHNDNKTKIEAINDLLSALRLLYQAKEHIGQEELLGRQIEGFLHSFIVMNYVEK